MTWSSLQLSPIMQNDHFLVLLSLVAVCTFERYKMSQPTTVIQWCRDDACFVKVKNDEKAWKLIEFLEIFCNALAQCECKRAVTITIAVRGIILRTEVQNAKDTSFPCNNCNSKIKLYNCILQRTITGQGMSHEWVWVTMKTFQFLHSTSIFAKLRLWSSCFCTLLTMLFTL